MDRHAGLYDLLGRRSKAGGATDPTAKGEARVAVPDFPVGGGVGHT